MISTVSAPSTPSLSISCEPTIPCSILSTQLQRPPYTTEPSTKSLSLNHQPREALPTSRLSTRATLVPELPASKPHLAPPHCETNNRESPEAVRGLHCITRAGGNAVDGTLSLSLRPAGWTRSVLGPSIRRLGAGTGGYVDLYRYTISNKVRHKKRCFFIQLCNFVLIFFVFPVHAHSS
ncbi:hypothetical protein BX661DRAFT_184437 [Kickxella alabastrina]|uniref:uncharacterized protein n=1 Tax=Kickxella alabastrina TaxID=61397 RepID=UPI00221E5567|nr:uncharacterized protein BX661DRAFT_184437 [Kickxella alabastrina]KAI7825946.1 hypothetical protein BX661DRAFT_184437 [Kickxella alabastrina]